MGKDLRGKSLEKGISQRKDGRYYARFTNRFGNRVEHYSQTLAEAKVWLTNAKADDNRKLNPVGNCGKLDDYFYNVWISIHKYGLSPNSIQQYKMVYDRHIKPKVGYMKMDIITTADIKNILKELDKDGYGYETKRRVRIMLLDMFNRAIEDRLLSFNPVKSIKLERPDNAPFVLSPEDEKDFFDCAKGTFYYNAYFIQRALGLRPGELFALTWRDVDFSNNVIHVNKSLVYQKYDEDTGKEFHIGPTKTESSVRDLKMTFIVREYFEKQKRLHKILEDKLCENKKLLLDRFIDTRYSEDIYQSIRYRDLVFTTRFLTPLCTQTYIDSIKVIVDEINLQRDEVDYLEEFSGHAFRHTFATRLYEETLDIKLVSSLLGHARVQTTADLYIHTTDRTIEQNLIKMEEALQKLDS